MLLVRTLSNSCLKAEICPLLYLFSSIWTFIRLVVIFVKMEWYRKVTGNDFGNVREISLKIVQFQKKTDQKREKSLKIVQFQKKTDQKKAKSLKIVQFQKKTEQEVFFFLWS